MIKIGENDGRITVSFPYNQAYISKVKSIKGYRWHPEEKYWSLPQGNVEKLISPKTIKAYLYYNKDFLEFVKKNPAEVTNEDVKNYLV